MNRRAKASSHRTQASKLQAQWGVTASQARYSDDGHWYAKFSRFPAALFDASGYLVFEKETDYLNSPHISIGKQIAVPAPGISAVPGYVRMIAMDRLDRADVDVHESEATEGTRRLVLHLERERNQTLVRQKKMQASSLSCEACGFSFEKTYGDAAAEYCEVHHLVPLAASPPSRKTRLQDLAVLCSNCHRVVHLRNPPFTLEELREMLNRPMAT